MGGEPQYQDIIALMREVGTQSMGVHASWAFYDDPRRLTFTFARYNFAATMVAGAKCALEIGCADGFASRIVRQVVEELVCVDFDPEFIASARDTASPRWPIEFRLHDVLNGPVEGVFDALLSLDVLEHVRPEDEMKFLSNAVAPLTPNGVAVIGMPSLNSQDYASALSRAGHVNCKHQEQLKALMGLFFHNVFMFSMNDEVVHTGYAAMAHYHLALCCNRKEPLSE
jgi:2-polyprenyl-3-methyl-5-hydroxy-6-metoxy-1,4-benzoquinol methylase